MCVRTLFPIVPTITSSMPVSNKAMDTISSKRTNPNFGLARTTIPTAALNTPMPVRNILVRCSYSSFLRPSKILTTPLANNPNPRISTDIFYGKTRNYNSRDQIAYYSSSYCYIDNSGRFFQALSSNSGNDSFYANDHQSDQRENYYRIRSKRR